MPTNYPPTEGAAFKYQYVNATQQSGDTVTSALLGATKTAFASQALIPESSATIGGIAYIKASGLYGSGVVSLSQTVTIEMQGQVVASASFTPALNVTNLGWSMEVSATILANGTIEIQGSANFGTVAGSTVFSTKNATPFTMSMNGGVPVTVSNQFGGVSVGGTISMRQLIVQVS